MKLSISRGLVVGLLCMVGLSPACGDDDTSPQTDATATDATTTDDVTPADGTGPEDGKSELGNLAEVATEAGSFGTLLAAVEAAGLSETVATGGPFTVLAPTDEAFAKLGQDKIDELLLPENKEMLASILTYHVIDGSVGSDVVVTLSEAVSLQGEKIAIEVVDGKVVLNGTATVVTPDVPASNGVIHVIDTVILPPSMTEKPLGNIPEVATEAGMFETLLAAVTAADLAETLAGDGPFTVLAPTDDAFAKLPEGTVDSLLLPENKESLVKVLTYHVIEGSVGSDTVVTLDEAATLQGEAVAIAVVDGKVVLNGTATVTTADVPASNGLIHIIDTVLMPPSMAADEPGNLAEVATADGNFNTLLAAVEAAGLTETLATGGPFTVLAPTDAAFDALPEGLLDSLLEPDSKETLTAILTYHLIDGEVTSDAVVNLEKAASVQGEDIMIEVVEGKVVLNGSATVTVTDVAASNGVIHVIDAVLVPPSVAENL